MISGSFVYFINSVKSLLFGILKPIFELSEWILFGNLLLPLKMTVVGPGNRLFKHLSLQVTFEYLKI